MKPVSLAPLCFIRLFEAAHPCGASSPPPSGCEHPSRLEVSKPTFLLLAGQRQPLPRAPAWLVSALHRDWSELTDPGRSLWAGVCPRLSVRETVSGWGHPELMRLSLPQMKQLFGLAWFAQGVCRRKVGVRATVTGFQMNGIPEGTELAALGIQEALACGVLRRDR